MVAIPLASKSDPAEREVVTEETLINLRAVKAPEGARCPFYLNRTPGFTAWSRCSSDLCRGMFAATSTLAIAVYGSTLFKFTTGGLPTTQGTISGTGDLRFSINNVGEVVIITGTTAYQYATATGTLTVISDGDLPANPIDTVSIDGYMLYLFADRRVFYSAINNADAIDALDFFTVPGKGDLVAGMVFGNQIIFWGSEDFQIYNRDPSDANEPFQLVKGAGKPFGCINTFANANVGGLICWVDQYGVTRSLGAQYLAQQLSNAGVQSDIRDLEDKSEIRLWDYVSGETGFLVVRSSEFTWVYDFKESRWHNRLSYQRTTWQAKHHMRFANKDIIAPDQSGDAFYLDDSTHKEDDRFIVWEFTPRPVTNFPGGGDVNRLDLDIEPGTALGATAAEEDQMPVVTMFRSVDAGKTWKTGRQRDLGTRGQWRKQVSWIQCGDFGREGVMFRFSGSAGVPHAIMNLAADIKPNSL